MNQHSLYHLCLSLNLFLDPSLFDFLVDFFERLKLASNLFMTEDQFHFLTFCQKKIISSKEVHDELCILLINRILKLIF